MIQEVQANASGFKVVTNALMITRKDKYIFSLKDVSTGKVKAPYVFSNDDVSKQGAIDLLNYMLQFSLNTTEIWETNGNTYPDVNFIYIMYTGQYSFHLAGVKFEYEIPQTFGNEIVVFSSSDTSDAGMIALLQSFMNWYGINA